MTNLLESCRVAPPPHTVADQSLPLTFLDYIWLPFHPIRRLLFYHVPNCTKLYFLETLVPKLKQSLSLTLINFFPLAGSIVRPSDPANKPVIRYRAGDSVSFTVFESGEDFDDLVGNHARDADRFYDFIPPLEQRIDEESDEKVLETLAIRVTLFPGRGVCIGFSNHHAVGDASSIVGFMKSWALINYHGADDHEFLNSNRPEPLPVFDRSLIKYPPELDSVFLNQISHFPEGSHAFPLPTNRVRATFVLTRSEMNKLKGSVQARLTELSHLSSFVVMAAYVWSCLAKSLTGGDDDEPKVFLFPVDARARINPPVPENYFGNCVSYGLSKVRHRELIGEDGFFVAAVAIAEEIENRVIKNENILSDAENWLANIGSAFQGRILSNSGSSKVDLCSADFGWGRARKLEALSNDAERYSMSVYKSRDVDGGLEIGLSLPKLITDDFAARFYDGIKA